MEIKYKHGCRLRLLSGTSLNLKDLKMIHDDAKTKQHVAPGVFKDLQKKLRETFPQVAKHTILAPSDGAPTH